MILSDTEILKNIKNNNIVIQPFDKKKLNPNSYNLTLSRELIKYRGSFLDVKEFNDFDIILIPENGFLLLPGEFYLARTNEYTGTQNLVPQISGRSSIGRLGLSIHITAGFGDSGFCGYWTLELSCLKALRIYADIEICQIYYHTLKGECNKSYEGKYQNNRGIQSSKSYRDF